MNEGWWNSGLVGNSTFWQADSASEKEKHNDSTFEEQEPKDLTSTFQSKENSMSSQAWLSPVLWNDREEGNCFETCSIFFFGVSWGWQGVAVERRPGHSIYRMFTRHEVFFKRRPSPTVTLATQTEILESEHTHPTPPSSRTTATHAFLPHELSPSLRGLLPSFLQFNRSHFQKCLITGWRHCYIRGLNKSPWIPTCWDLQ